MVSLFSAKSLKLLPPYVIFQGLKCTKFDFGWGSVPDPTGGAYSAESAPPDPLAGFKGPILLREGEGKGWRRKGRAVSYTHLTLPTNREV